MSPGIFLLITDIIVPLSLAAWIAIVWLSLRRGMRIIATMAVLFALVPLLLSSPLRHVMPIAGLVIRFMPYLEYWSIGNLVALLATVVFFKPFQGTSPSIRVPRTRRQIAEMLIFIASGLVLGSVPFLLLAHFWNSSHGFREHLAFASLFFPIGVFYLSVFCSVSIGAFAVGFVLTRTLATPARRGSSVCPPQFKR